jgi:hypothetical protein
MSNNGADRDGECEMKFTQIKNRLAVLRSVTASAIARCLERQSQAVAFAKEQAILDSQVQEMRCALSKLELGFVEQQQEIPEL